MEATPNPTPETPATAEAAPATAKPTSGSRTQALLDKINATLKPAQAPAETAPVQTEASGEPSTLVEGEAEPEAQPKGYAHQLAAAMMKAQKAESETLRQKAAFETQAKQLAELQAKIDAASADPVKALELANLDPAAFGELMLQGKLQAPAPKPELPPEVQQLLEEAKATKERAAREAEERQAAEFRAQNLKTIEGLMAGAAAEFPLVAALPGVHERLLDAIEWHVAEHGSEPDFKDVLTRAQAGVLKEAAAVLGNRDALSIILKDEAVKSTVMEALGLQNTPAQATTQPVPGKQSPEGKPTKTLTSKVTGAVPSRVAKAGNSADLAARINREILTRGV